MNDLTCINVSKRYFIREDTSGSPRGWLTRFRSSAASKPFWAVRDLNLQVPHGQILGVIGHNGAGKSTLLKLLSSITAPTAGEIQVRGRLAALLEVGSGFHPELTGRENIFLSGSILGMSGAEIRRKLDRIIDFAEIRPFIDLPVKRYSSGMYVRLGFSIAAHLEPDVLLLDEVLAVGDAAFQQKCKSRIMDLHRAGTTIIFISHDLKAVESMCDRVIVMNRGAVIFDGGASSAIAHYCGLSTAGGATVKAAGMRRRVEVTSVACLSEAGERLVSLETGQPIRVRVDYRCLSSVNRAKIDLYFNGPAGLQCVFSTRHHPDPPSLTQGEGAIEFIADELALAPDVYRLDVMVEEFGEPDPLEWIVGAGSLHVAGGPDLRGGVFFHPHRWHVTVNGEQGQVEPKVLSV